MFDPSFRAQVGQALARLEGDVTLWSATDDTEAGRTVGALLAALAALSDRVRVVAAPAPVARRPSFGVGRAGEQPRVWFAGAPLGHEFSSLILAMLQVSGVAPRIDADTRAAVDAVAGPLHLETWVSLSCHNCPDVVQAAVALAVLRPDLTHTLVDGAVFAEEVERRAIQSVPLLFADGAPVSSGRVTLPELLARLPRRAAVDAPRQPYALLVVGGGPAGAAAALYAARKGLRTGLVAERIGGQVGDTLGIENLVTTPYTEGPALVSALDAQVRAAGVEVLAGRRVTALEVGGGAARHRLQLDGGGVLEAPRVVLAPGARWRELGVPGEATYKTRGVAFCPHCDGPLFRGKRVAVIGGGNSGVEAAIDLAGLAAEVTLFEVGPALRADAVLQARLARTPRVTVQLGAQVREITGDGQRVDGLRWWAAATGVEQHTALEGVFVQIGLVPHTDWLRGAVPLDARGHIVVDARGATGVPGVYAAGDATNGPFKQIAIALGDGARASLSAFEDQLRVVA
jgi:alkyl hydroperoxide reductase subunit F